MQKLVDFINQNLAIIISVFCALIFIIIVLLIRAIIITKNKTKANNNGESPIKPTVEKNSPAPAKVKEEPKILIDKTKSQSSSAERPVLIEKSTDAKSPAPSSKTSEQTDFYSQRLREKEIYDYSQNIAADGGNDFTAQNNFNTPASEKLNQSENIAKTNFSLKIVKLSNGEFRFKIENQEKNVLLSKNFASFEMAKEYSEILKNLIKTTNFEIGESANGYRFYLKYNGEFLVSSVNFSTSEEASTAANETKQNILNGTI